MLSRLSKITNPDNTTQFKLVKDPNSKRVNDLLIHNSIPVTLHDNLLTFRVTGKIFEMKGDLLIIIIDKNYNVDLSSLSDKQIMFDFAKRKNFDVRGQGNKSNRDRTLKELLESPGLMVSASGVSRAIFLSSDPNELCDRINFLLQEYLRNNKSNIYLNVI